MEQKQKLKLSPEPDDWKNREYAFFSHKACELFPCHKTDDPENFNCLFCWCPLYALGGNCGGNFSYTETGIKDCGNCLLPHGRKNYGYIMNRFQDIVNALRRMESETGDETKQPR